MYLNQLTPKNNVLKYIPDYLVNDDVKPEMLPVLSQFLSKEMNMEQCFGFLSELSGMHLITRNEHPDFSEGTKGTWLSTPDVVDVRLLFREFNKSSKKSGSLGSKMRLYSMSRDDGGNESVQAIDSGFITYNSYPSPQVVFQSALAQTMFYNSLYAIGSRATVRKINEANKNRTPNSQQPTTYKWLSALRPLKTDGLDHKLFNHILHPAAFRAGIEDPSDFFEGLGGNKMLDKMMDVFITAQSMDDLRKGLLGIKSLELYDSDIDEIFEHCSSSEANLDGAKDFEQGNAEGINIVILMEHLGDIFA